MGEGEQWADQYMEMDTLVSPFHQTRGLLANAEPLDKPLPELSVQWCCALSPVLF